MDELAWRTERAKAFGITLGTEAHVGSLAPDPATAKRLAESVPGLTLTLDYTHFTRAGLPDDAVEPLLAHASHFHVRGARPGRLQAPFKDNVIDYRRVVRRLQKAGYADGSASSTCGSTGSTATSATTSRRRFCFATSCGPWRREGRQEQCP